MGLELGFELDFRFDYKVFNGNPNPNSLGQIKYFLGRGLRSAGQKIQSGQMNDYSIKLLAKMPVELTLNLFGKFLLGRRGLIEEITIHFLNFRLPEKPTLY